VSDEIFLAPCGNISTVGTSFTFMVSLEAAEGISEDSGPFTITFDVLSGPNAGLEQSATVPDAGTPAFFTYSSATAGTDILQAHFFDPSDQADDYSNFASQVWNPKSSFLSRSFSVADSGPPAGPVASSQPNCRLPALVKTPGSTSFTPVQPNTPLPAGTQVDVSGETALTVANTVGQQMTFFGLPDGVPSLFTITSAPTGNATISLALGGGNFGVCKKGSRSLSVYGKDKPKKPKAVRRLWGSGKGKYKTTGKYASATVLGTYWQVEDFCNGTLVSVRKGIVKVFDAVLKKTITVKSGKSYFAYAPGQHP
jgi:hypothetical protein